MDRTTRIWLGSVAVLAVVASALVLVGAYYRGGSFDEFATFRFADPSVPFGVAWRSLWPTETNPPFFYMIARVAVDAVGPSLFARRMVNLLSLLFLLVWFAIAVARNPAHRGFLAGLALFGFCGKVFVFYFPEYRSYFWQYCAELVFVGAATIGYLDRRRLPDPFQLAVVPVLVLLHQVTALYAGVLAALLILADLRRRFWLRAGSLALVCLLSAIPLVVSTWLQLHQSHHLAGLVAWIRPLGTFTALWWVAGYLPPDLAQNWIAILAAVAALMLTAYRPRGDTAALASLLAFAAAVATAAILVINRYLPLTVDRYFTFLAVEIACIMVLVVEPMLRAKPWLAGLIFLTSAIYLGASSVQLIRDRRWDRGAEMVAALVAQCPATRVHAGSLPVNDAEQTGLAFVAAPWHLHLLPVAPDVPGVCPVLYWTEYKPASRTELALFHGDAVRATNYRARLGLSEAVMSHTIAIKTQNGIILEVRATKH